MDLKDGAKGVMGGGIISAMLMGVYNEDRRMSAA